MLHLKCALFQSFHIWQTHTVCKWLCQFAFSLTLQTDSDFRLKHSPHVSGALLSDCAYQIVLVCFFACKNLQEPQQNKLATNYATNKETNSFTLTCAFVSIRNENEHKTNKKRCACDLITFQWFVNSMYRVCRLRNRMPSILASYHLPCNVKWN